MRRSLLGLITVCLAISLGCDGATTETTVPVDPGSETAAATEPAAEKSVRHDVVYVCDCGSDCDCNSVSTEPGKCTCGTDLKWAHLVKVEGNEALLCTCAEGCSCELDPEDESKCACGKDLRRVSLEGTGLYFCNCGGSCTCNMVSAEPGSCHCGMELISSS